MSEPLHDPRRRSRSSRTRPTEGKSARTPWLILGGMQLVVLVIVAVVLAIVFTVYLLA